MARTMVGVWAHPDDETYLSAGLMLAARRREERVVCVTATRGEAGIQDESRWPASRLVAIRERELKTALGVLGVDEHRWLGYPDGGCRDVPRDEAVERIATLIGELRPQLVLTFGPDGLTGHPDHIAVSSWTTEAFHRAAPASAVLYYASITPSWFDRFGRQWLDAGAFMGHEVPITPEDEIALAFELDDETLDAKIRALKAQPSQTEAVFSLFGDEMMRASQALELFRAAPLGHRGQAPALRTRRNASPGSALAPSMRRDP